MSEVLAALASYNLNLQASILGTTERKKTKLCKGPNLTVFQSFMGSTCNLSVRLCGCGHACLKFLKFRAEHCTK